MSTNIEDVVRDQRSLLRRIVGTAVKVAFPVAGAGLGYLGSPVLADMIHDPSLRSLVSTALGTVAGGYAREAAYWCARGIHRQLEERIAQYYHGNDMFL